LLDEAKTEISRIQGNIADIQLVEAKVARLQGNPEEALMLADQVLSSPGFPSCRQPSPAGILTPRPDCL
jgi:hypothetical protein